MRALLATAVAAAATAAGIAGVAHAASSIVYDDTLVKGKPVSVTITTHRPAAFRVLLRVATQGRTRLFLTGAHAPKGGPLIDTKTSSCEGAAGSYYCEGSYEPLPAGTYTWRIVRVTGPKEAATLTLKW